MNILIHLLKFHHHHKNYSSVNDIHCTGFCARQLWCRYLCLLIFIYFFFLGIFFNVYFFLGSEISETLECVFVKPFTFTLWCNLMLFCVSQNSDVVTFEVTYLI